MSTDPEGRKREGRRRRYQRRAVDQHLKLNEQDLNSLLQGSAGAIKGSDGAVWGSTGAGGAVSASSRRAHKWPCNICNVRCTSEKDYQAHLDGKRHRVTCLLYALNNNMRTKLSADKEDIKILSKFDKDQGSIHFDAEHKMETVVEISVHNSSEEASVYLWGYELLKPLRQFKVDHPQRAGGKTRAAVVIRPGASYEVRVRVTLRQFGHRSVPLAFLFTRESDPSQKIHIVRFLRARCVNQLMKDLAPTAPYQKRSRVAVGNIRVDIVDGFPLPESPVPKKLENSLKLSQYWIPEHVRKLINSGLKVYNGMDSKAEQVRSLLQSLLESKSLNPANYNEMLQNLLWVEEIQMEVDIRQYDMEGVTMAICNENKRLLTLQVPGLAEKRPSVLKGDPLFVRYLHNGQPEDLEYKGYVHEVREREVCLGFSQKLLNKHVEGMKFNVRFTFSRFPLKLGHRSVSLSDENSLYPLLFPTRQSACTTGTIVPVSTQLKLYDRQLERNEQQVAAVKYILAGSSRPAPYIIFGPPGTGKTVTVVEAIKQVVKHIPSSHVLACAPSNAAVDLITERLVTSGHIQRRDVYRINALSRDHRTIPDHLIDICNWNTEYRAFEYPAKEKLQSYKVILCTLVTAGRLVSANFPQGHFTHIFIDECGHSVEPEAVIPIAGILECGLSKDGGQVVLAGDPKQLGPVLRSPLAIRCGLGVSLLERLMNVEVYRKTSGYQNTCDSYNPRLVTKLLHNYRSHPAILRLPNQMFYDDELIAKADKLARESMCEWEELPKKKFPLIFHGIVGKDEREERSPSFFNTAEVATVVDYIEKLLACRQIKVNKKDIGVITPYTRQVQKIKKAFRKKNWADINVGSTEEFQGQEKKVIIISTVRSRPEFLEMDVKFNLGFLINPKRFNVSVTRAKALLIVIGNPFFLSKDENWNELLEYCVDNGGYKGTEFIEAESTGEDWDKVLHKINALGLDKALAESDLGEEKLEVYDRQHIPETGWKSEH